MMDPKLFYRKIDALLAYIGDADSYGADLLTSVLHRLGSSFGKALHFGGGRLYEEAGEGFVLSETTVAGVREEVPLTEPAVRLVLRHGSYIYDREGREVLGHGEEELVPAAFVVSGGEGRRWLFVFDLYPGWEREAIQLCLNAVRAALNVKLSSGVLKTTLEQAAQIQQSLLPTAPPSMAGFAFAGRSQPAEHVGGDLYDYIRLSEEMIGVSIGDATGHGLPAALLVRDVVTGLRMGLEDQRKIVYTIRKLNQVIHRSTLSTRFISLFYGEVEQNGNLLYVNCGHPPALLVQGDEVRELGATGTVLGPLPDLSIHRAYAYLAPGSTLLLYTDGVIERRNRGEEMYEIEKLKRFLVQHQHLPAPALVQAVFDEVYAFGNEGAWGDDATVVVVQRLANGPDGTYAR